MALAAALLGWMFDGLEQGLFPLVARPALLDLLGSADEGKIGLWFSVATAGFLVGAATGGVLFGWLGDRIGRVRAMMLTVLTYAVFSGLCGLATAAWQIAALRFGSALGMGGEWSLGVALVMEIWPEKSRAFLAGLIGAAANVGFLLIALVGLGLTSLLQEVQAWLQAIGLSESSVQTLVAHNGWRLLMLFGAAPALLTLFIRLFVPESERWLQEQKRGATSSWATRDLLGVAIGALGACLIIYLWTMERPWPSRLPGAAWSAEHPWLVRSSGTALGLLVATAGYTYPVVRYLQRCGTGITDPLHTLRPTMSRMLLGACLGGVALTSTWGASQWIPLWADQLAGSSVPQARSYTQICSALGAILGTLAGAMAGRWFGRRFIYALLCLSSLGSALLLYQCNRSYGLWFLACVFLVGCTTASFYGWLPLYLPELFRTGVRATGQGFSYNFGRILAAMGVLQTGNLMNDVFKNNYPNALSVVSLVYLIGLALIWLAPETFGKGLPA
jgi:MFS family permease